LVNERVTIRSTNTGKEETEKGMDLKKFNEVCEAKKITVKELVALWNCTRQAVWCKKNGKYPITLDEAKKFSDYAKLTNQERIDIFLT
jgi:hypothetical protein